MIPLTDNPAQSLDQDWFGFDPYVRELHAAVLAAEPLPLTVGVFGSWGTGKSSFLQMWRHLLDGVPGTRTVWFNPWKYDRKVEVWAALLHTILAEIEQNEGLKDRAGRLARAATWLSLRAGLGHAASLATAGIIGREDIDALLDTFSAEDAEEYRRVNGFEHEFADAVEQFVGPEGRLVIFIDDLDRCTPEAAVTVLESLKLFLGQARCVFVLALDVDVLAAVATNKFGAELRGAPQEAVSGMAYLEKIVQLPFFLPDIGFPSLRAALASHVGDLGGSDAFWDLVRIGLGTNPRRVKRYVNVLNLAAAVHQRIHGDDGARRRLQLAELLIIRSEHRAFFHTLTRQPDAWRLLEVTVEQIMQRPAGRDLALAQLPPYLASFSRDEALLRLLETCPGAYNDHPPAPEGHEVVQMISTLRVASGPLLPGDGE
ncbi:KAP family P-loop NTPase fold protein [Nonomuraea bangladeshensis]|uniref:KAP family P-loop NTPase fold protein n=1 Tax=Nonomuraea bangladeshensis TaxID=404385 RepID=UPI003C2FB422